MVAKENIVTIPFTDTARKYGYIIWKKRHDDLIKQLIGARSSIDIKFKNKIQRKKYIDWNRRRIGITYTLTRQLPNYELLIRLQPMNRNCILVEFVKGSLREGIKTSHRS